MPDEKSSLETILQSQFKFTPRRLEVALLILEGKQYKEIADELKLPETTIRTRIHKMYKKLNVNNKMEFSNLVRRQLNLQ